LNKRKILEKKKKDDITPTTILTTPTIESSPIPTLSATTDDTFEKHIEELQKPDDRLGATIEKITTV